jgi:dTDP-4-amino-4,6-dideoxygalactose transaminase
VAVFGRSQVARLPEMLGRRQRNFAALKDGLSGIRGVRVIDTAHAAAENSHYCLVAVLDDSLAPFRNDVVARLNAAGVGTSVYYPQPVNRMKYYRTKYGYDAAKFAGAAKLSDHGVALPVGPHLGPEDMAYIARSLRTVMQEVAR